MGAHEHNVAYICQYRPWSDVELFGIYDHERLQPLWCLGQSKTGKTTLLTNLAIQDVYRGYGIAFFDPLADAAEQFLNHLSPEMTNRVVYVNPGDMARPIGLNLLETVQRDLRTAVAEHLMTAFKGIYKDMWGIQLERILRNAIRAQLDNPHGTMLGIPKMLYDRPYRQSVTKHITDPMIAEFWRDFETWDKRDRQQAIRPVLNRLEQWLGNPVIRNMLSQERSSIDLRDIIAKRMILVVNLNIRRLGEDPATLLGSLLLARLKGAAEEVGEGPELFSVYLDEAHRFAPSTLAGLCNTSSRDLAVALATQSMGQLDPAAREALLASVGTVVSFRVGYDDAAELVKLCADVRYKPDDFTERAQHTVIVKQLHTGFPQPIAGWALPPLSEVKHDLYHGRADVIIKTSRKRYGRRRGIIEDKVRRFLTGEDGAGGKQWER